MNYFLGNFPSCAFQMKCDNEVENISVDREMIFFTVNRKLLVQVGVFYFFQIHSIYIHGINVINKTVNSFDSLSEDICS